MKDIINMDEKNILKNMTALQKIHSDLDKLNRLMNLIDIDHTLSLENQYS